MKLFRKSRDDVRGSRMVDHRAIEAQEQYRLYQQHKQRYPQQQPHSAHYQHPPPMPPNDHHRSRQMPTKHHQRQHLHHQQEQPMVENEYEYVRREYGFDYMPPSQYVPSRSMSEETDDVEDGLPVKIVQSDLSISMDEGSFEVEYDPQHARRKPKMPVVRGRPVDVKAMAKRIDKEKHMKSRKSVPQHYQRHHKAPVPVEEMERFHRTRVKPKLRRNYEETYPGEEDSALFSGASPIGQASRPATRREKVPKGYDQHLTRGGPDLSVEHGYLDDEQEDLPRIPTAESYDSRDSMEEAIIAAKVSRYDTAMEAKKEAYRRYKKEKASHVKKTKREKRRGETAAYEYTNPTFHGRHRPEPVPGVIIEAPQERRSDTHQSRRRSKSKDFREPVERLYEDPPLGMEPPRDNFEQENGYVNEPYYGDPRVAQTYPSSDPGIRRQELMRERMELQANGMVERQRTKGLFGRIKGGFRGDKSSKLVVERAWGQELREKDTLLGKTPPSFGTDLSPYPTYKLDVPSAHVPYPYDDGYYEEATRMTSKPAPVGAVHPPHPHPRQQRGYDQRAPPPDYMYEEGPGQKYVQSSGKPFQTSRTTTPILRANADQRQRYIPMNASMSKQYRSQNQGMGGNATRGRSLSPGGLPRRGILGCV